MERRLWGDLPLHDLRRVTVVLEDQGYPEDIWVVDMLREVEFLELLELGGDCGQVLRYLRHRMLRGVMGIDIKTLIVRGGEYAKSQTLKFESVKDDLGLQNMTVTYIQDSEGHERLASDSDAESSSDVEVRDKELDEDDEGDYIRGLWWG